jgi:hypothetical protein
MTTERIEAFWQDATADDVARVMAGETVEARFRDSAIHLWMERLKLAGVIRGLDGKPRWIASTGSWVFCQVYREPSWWTNKPDPGPEWRLLNKFPDEELKPGDEGWDLWRDGQWAESENAKDGSPQQPETWYRRRIEREPKFAVDQMVRVIGPKVRPDMHWGKEMDPHIGFVGVIRSIPIREGESTFYNLEGVGIWCFREDYLEPVEPEPKHYVLRVGDSCETPNGNRTIVVSQERTQSFVNFGVGDVVKTIHGQTITITEKGYEVTQ